MWVRTNRRAPGEDHLDPNAKRRPGPWHIDRGYGLTWCGRKPAKVSVGGGIQRLALGAPPEGDRRCGECIRAEAAGKPKPYRRR